MKTLVVLLFVVVNVFACTFDSVSYKAKFESASVAESPAPDTRDCQEDNFKYKSESEVSAMTPRQLIDEEVKRQLNTFDDFTAWGDYGSLISKYVHKSGIKVLPVVVEYMNTYDPKRNSECEETRFRVAFTTSDGIDNAVVRLRGISEGQLALEALEHAAQRMNEAGLDNPDNKSRGSFDFVMLHLKGQKGTNIRDGIIRDTLQLRLKVQISDEELLEFSNFLISLDPTYPTWSKVGEIGPPPLLKDSKKYHEAYLKFKTKKGIARADGIK